MATTRSLVMVAFSHITFSNVIEKPVIQELSPSCWMGDAVAEWSKALLVRENKRKITKIPGSPPDLGTFFISQLLEVL